MFETRFAGPLVPVATLLVCAMAAATPARAQTATATLTVSATVTANCTVSTSALAFGNVNTLSGSNVDSTGGLAVTCTNGTAWTASAGVGAGSGASFASRRMTSGGNLLAYNLYTNAARTNVWGNGTAGTANLTGTGTGGAQNVTVYGRVGAGQTGAPAGSYARHRHRDGHLLTRMRSTMRFKSLHFLAASAALCVAAPAAAGTLQVNPVLVAIDHDHRTGSVTVRNEEATPVTIRAYPLAWRQADGDDVYEETAAMIVSPPVFTIPPGATQLVRVGLRNPAGANQAYRLIIEEVPEATRATGIRVALRLNLPLYAMIQPGSPAELRWSASRQSDGGWLLEAANPGSGYIRLDHAAAARATGFTFGDTIAFGTVLPGASRRWRLDASTPVADRAVLQQIMRTPDSGARTAQSDH